MSLPDPCTPEGTGDVDDPREKAAPPRPAIPAERPDFVDRLIVQS